MPVSKIVKRAYFREHGSKTVTPATFETNADGVSMQRKPATKTRTVDRSESLKDFARRMNNTIGPSAHTFASWFANKHPQKRKRSAPVTRTVVPQAAAAKAPAIRGKP